MIDANSFDGLVGRVFEKRYRILEPLGEGGMGAVFLGEHVVIGRQVAIKVLHPRLAESQDFADRFTREAVAAGRLDHPNCVPVTDSGQLDDGTAYMVMELVKGISLGELLERDGQLDPVRALRIARDMLRGLGHAHKVGIVHRDVKPDNVMLSERDDNPDFARVLDFGIAKLRDDNNKDTQALTQAGMSVGTPSYLSPEQAMGEEVDHRSDLYSAAVVLFEMLAGRPPYQAPNPVGILTKHASSPIPHLWEVEETLVNPDLDALMQRGLAKLRDERYADAAEFIAAIEYTLVRLGDTLTPVPQTGNYASVGPMVTEANPRAQTGPPLGGEYFRAQTGPPVPEDRPQRAQTEPPGTGAAPPRKAAGFTTRHATIAALALALLGGIIFLASGSDEEKDAGPSLSAMKLEQVFQENIELLKTGKTCKERLVAVKALHSLKDDRAIPALKKARRRMRGGTLGIGAKNTNACLRKAANRAITSLGKEP